MTERECDGCQQNACAKTHCGACCGGRCKQEMIMAPTEIAILKRLAESPFLPLVKKPHTGDQFMPIPDFISAEYETALLALSSKGLISMDADFPLSNFDYAEYSEQYECGSIALTGRGQAVIDVMEIQGMDV
ncbi:MAG: hypothetical protein PHH65_02920 [Eubacteriales bacterium]|nr:hypothetical protein [Eubacteriales bacterium]